MNPKAQPEFPDLSKCGLSPRLIKNSPSPLLGSSQRAIVTVPRLFGRLNSCDAYDVCARTCLCKVECVQCVCTFVQYACARKAHCLSTDSILPVLFFPLLAPTPRPLQPQLSFSLLLPFSPLSFFFPPCRTHHSDSHFPHHYARIDVVACESAYAHTHVGCEYEGMHGAARPREAVARPLDGTNKREAAARPLNRTIDMRISIGECPLLHPRTQNVHMLTRVLCVYTYQRWIC